MLRIHDTALGKVVPLEPREAGKVGIYLCGPTVYDVPHLGHGRHALVWDVLRRYLEWRGLDVRFVSNVTDIEDKIIMRAQQEGRSTEAVVAEYEEAWYSAIDRLGVRRPDFDPHASDYVEKIVAFIAGLVEEGTAYETDDGVYFEVARLPGYGLLAHQPLESLRAGARVDVDEAKRAPEDFALWKKAKPGEPTWPSPWGPGRPGWHIECTVMALELLGDGFDIHGAGQDLIFPHNENERAQALAARHQFARYWVHHGMVDVAGEKMSKSLGNFTSLADLLSRTDGRAYRLLVLRSHYRSPMEVTPDTTADAERALRRLDDFARKFANRQPVEPDPVVVDHFRELMDDDLDTPAATAYIFDLVRQANRALDDGDTAAAHQLASAVSDFTGALGLELRGVEEAPDAETQAMVAARDAARRQGDFAEADRIRDRLQEEGWVVEDSAAGTRVHRRGG